MCFRVTAPVGMGLSAAGFVAGERSAAALMLSPARGAEVAAPMKESLPLVSSAQSESSCSKSSSQLSKGIVASRPPTRSAPSAIAASCGTWETTSAITAEIRSGIYEGTAHELASASRAVVVVSSSNQDVWYCNRLDERRTADSECIGAHWSTYAETRLEVSTALARSAC